jgi:hypothetical protein
VYAARALVVAPRAGMCVVKLVARVCVVKLVVKRERVIHSVRLVAMKALVRLE